jgi:NitT/TauT family transport system substrate-binding protein
MRIGCVQEGGAVDVVLHKTIDKYGLDSEKVMANIQRMNPQKMALAIKMGQLDAAFMPEHWATMAEEFGFNMLVMSQDVWPDMQGSVLVVKADLLTNQPDVVKRLVKVLKKATDWINKEPADSAEIMARQLNAVGGNIFPTQMADVVAKLEITPAIVQRSMDRLDYTTGIDIVQVQATIDYMAGLGYISSSFNAAEILDLQFIK